MQLKLPDFSLYLEPRALLLEELNAFVNALDAPQTSQEACRALHELAAKLEQRSSSARGLRIYSMTVPGSDEPIRLILHPAIFEPEQWGRTFAEGLLKEEEIFSGKTIVELGTGSGWISILLLRKTFAKHILGLDLNPIAVAMARLNTWLNGTESDGTHKLTPAGLPLVQAFRVAVSDLLQEPLSMKERFDHVIGCIPQVLHPDPGALKKKRSLSNRDLYDLSNYCFEQGILEDRFGLPLIARALEQAQLVLNRGGLVTLILGGRPGWEAIDGMFRRRGYEPELWWSRRIQQADDTDIVSLVTLEKTHGIKFHFYASPSSQQTVPASTAAGLLEQNHPVFHDLLVVQARTRCEKPMLSFVRNINALGLGGLRREIDLSRVSEEQISFLDRLTEELLRHKTLPYPHERGDVSLRRNIARFLRTYCGYAAQPQQLFVGPERSQLVRSILSMVAQPGEKVLLSGALEKTYARTLESLHCQSILGNDDLSELVELDNLFAPRISILAPQEMADPSPLVLQAFINQANAHPDRWYLIDDSANFDIGSALKSNVMMRLLAQHPLPPNLVFLYGLIKNTVCPDLELSFTINAPESWIEGLDVAAELSYSRIPYPSQLYYEWLFDELLSFPFPDTVPAVAHPVCAGIGKLSAWFMQVAEDPAFAPKPIDVEGRHVIRMDYGEMEAPAPNALVRGLVKGFLAPSRENIANIVASRVSAYMKFTRKVNINESRIALGQGAFPLLGSVVGAMKSRLGRAPVVALPHGSYGLVSPLIEYHGGQVVEIPTDPEHGFMVTLQSLARMHDKPDLLWLTQPNNPSGLFFDPDTVAGIIQLCAERGTYILADEIFFLLSDPALGSWTNPQLSFGSFMDSAESKWLFLADGLSKSFAAGGLRSGFMVCPDESWATQVQSLTMLPPSATLRAWDSLYSAFLDKPPHQLMNVETELAEVQNYLNGSRAFLHEQRERLLALLRKHGLSDGLDTAKRGGLFVLARLDEQQCRELAEKENLLANPPSWAPTPGFARLCFSLEPARFNAAVARLEHFFK